MSQNKPETTATKTERLKDQICPQCKRQFILCWDDYGDKRQTLFLRSCPSGGIYDASIRCPNCNYEEAL